MSLRPLFFASILFGALACNDRQPGKAAEPVVKSPSLHSAAFNNRVDSVMESYYALTEAFVNWDSVNISSKASELDVRIKNLSLDELDKDPQLRSKANLALFKMQDAILDIDGQKDIITRRRQFNNFSGELFNFLDLAKFDQKPLYLQQCPMAFNDTEEGVWISDKGKDSIRNPYLGLHHPRYKGAMIDCGGNKAIIDLTSQKK